MERETKRQNVGVIAAFRNMLGTGKVEELQSALEQHLPEDLDLSQVLCRWDQAGKGHGKRF